MGTVGKWGGASFLFGIIITAFILGTNNPLYAYMADIVSSNSYQSTQPTELKLNLDPISNLNNITLPVNELINDALHGLRFDQSINIGTGTPFMSPIKTPSEGIDFNKFFSSSKVSSNDLTSFLKEAAVTGINLSILVISITSQVLKGLLEAIK